MMTPVPLPAPLENRQSHQGFPATVSSRGASTTRRRGSTSGRVAARRATSGSAPSSKRPASENEDLNPAPAASCTLQEKDIRVLQVVDNQVEKACGLRSIYELVVISQREWEHLTHCHLPPQRHRHGANPAHAENRHLRVVGDGRRVDTTYGSIIRDGERTPVKFIQPQLALLSSVHQIHNLFSDEEDALPIRFLDVGHHQSGLGVDGQTDVVVPLQQYLFTAYFQDGIQAGETPQSHGTRLHNEGQVRELNPPF